MESPFANELESVLDHATTQSILAVLETIRVADWLEQHPFSRLCFQRQVLYQQRQVNGMYSYQDKIAQICVTRDDYGQEFEWGKIDKVSNTAKTLLQAIIFTFLHELGHHIHAALRDIDKFRFGMTLRVIRTNAISNYAKSPLLQLEYFAETFAAWVLYRAELRLKDQFGYAMIAAALAVLELEIKELTA